MAPIVPPALSVEDFRQNLSRIQERVAAACARVGRDPAEVRILPVSKTVPEERLRIAYEAGFRELGENKVQEAERKASNLDDLTDLHWVVIGHLQSNKAKSVARFAHEFQALDRLRIAKALDRHLQAEGRSLNVFIQVNTSGEDTKFGLRPEEVEAFVQELPKYPSLKVKGLMTLALFSSDESKVRPCFELLRVLRDRLREVAPEGMSFDDLSMGMSGDLELAVEEGATTIRVGQAIFGPRDLPDSHYWPGGS